MIIIDPLFIVLDTVLYLYLWALIISVVLSWLIAFNVVNTSNRAVYMIVDFLYRITEPALRRIRRFMPDLGTVDISPFVLMLGIYFARLVLTRLHFALLRG